MHEVKGFCTLCRSQCGTINLVDGSTLVSVRPDPDHPTGAAACLKGKAAPEIIRAPNRLLHPMRRTRPKTDDDPGWERIGWDEALAICAERLGSIRAESGAESVAFAVTTKSGTAIADSVEWIDRFVRIFGSPNVAGAVDICNWHKDNAHKFTFGNGTPPADYANAELILVWGHNPTSTWLAQAEAISKGRSRGAKMIVVDPRGTPLANNCDVWLQVRPGTDAALAMGLAGLLIAGQHYDPDFVRRWTNAPLLVRGDTGEFLKSRDVWPDGQDTFVVWNQTTGAAQRYDTERALAGEEAAQLALLGRFGLRLAHGDTVVCRPAFDLYAQACSAWTPAQVEACTGVPQDRLHAAAALLGSRKRIAYHAWNGVGQGLNATQTERAIATLYALRGAFDDIGGNRIYAKQPVNKVDALGLIHPEQARKALGLAERPLGPPAEGRVKPIDVYRAMHTGVPYRIRALVGFGTNHLLTQTDIDGVRQGLETCEFHVHCDMVETPTSRYADIVLPICTPWERDSLRVGFEISEAAENHIQFRPAMVPPRGESRSDLDVVFDLACRLGHADRFFGGSVEAGWNHILEPIALTVDALRARPGGIARPLLHTTRKYARTAADGRVQGFATPTRRVEFYSELLLRAGQSPLPLHGPDAAADARFPLLITSMKNGYFTHSQHRAISSLRKRSPHPVVCLHPSLAQRNGIVEGSWVRVHSAAGSASFVARFDAQLHPEVLSGEFGFWENSEALGLPGAPFNGRRNSNFNQLVSADRRDPISGSTNHKAVPCNIEPDTAHGAQRWEGFQTLRIIALAWETPGALRIHIGGAQKPLPDYIPGQYLKIRVFDRGPDEGVARAYSLVGNAEVTGRDEYVICVGQDATHPEYPGRMSSHLHTHLRVGDRMDVEAPQGIFTIPTVSSRPVVMVATGIGITPFVSYLESLVGRAPPHPMLLLYGNQHGGKHAFRQRLAELVGLLPTLQVVNYYSAPRSEDVQGLHYQRRGRIDIQHVDEALLRAQARIYICGSAAVVDGVRNTLRERGVPAFAIFSELFLSGRRGEIDTASDTVFQVEFRRSGKRLPWRPQDGTLLGFAEKHEVRAPSGCRVGQCESCAVPVLAGTVRHLHCQEPEEPRTVLTCQAVPAEDLVLDI